MTAPASPRVTEPLREEHRGLLPHVKRLRALGDAADGAPEAWLPLLDESLAFLEGHLLVHARAEEQSLYPVVAVMLGGLQATATMTRDHVAIAQLVAELAALRRAVADAGGRPRPEDVRALRRLAYGLSALVETHFAKEEEVYLPVLDERLAPQRASDMFALMERAAAEARDERDAAARR